MDGQGTMAIKLEAIRSAASRVAASHGLEVVNIEFIGPSKEQTLRVFLEKNAEQRARLKAAIAAGAAQKAGAVEEIGTGAVEAEEAKAEVARDESETLLKRLVQQVREGELSLDRLEQLSGLPTRIVPLSVVILEFCWTWKIWFQALSTRSKPVLRGWTAS